MMLENLSGSLIGPLILLFSLATLLNMGLATTADDFALALRDKRSLARALLANAVLTPMLVWVLLRGLAPLGEALAGQQDGLVALVDNGTIKQLLEALLGQVSSLAALAADHQLVVLLLALAGGNVLAPALAQIAHARADYARAITVTAALLSCLALPLGLALLPLSTAGGEASVGAAGAAGALGVLVGMQALPFAIGYVLRARYAEIALAVQPLAALLSNISFLALLLALFLPGGGAALPEVSQMVALAVWGVVLAAGALLIGVLMGGEDPLVGRGLGLVTGLRNISAVLAVLAFAGVSLAAPAADGQPAAQNVAQNAAAQNAAAALIVYLAILLLVTITAGEWSRAPVPAPKPKEGAAPVTPPTGAAAAAPPT